jgi:hypothetical protein
LPVEAKTSAPAKIASARYDKEDTMVRITKELRLKALDTLLTARMAHTQWMSAVTHEKAPCVESDPQKCVFGRWILEEQNVLEQLPEFLALAGPHRELHEAYARLKLDANPVELHTKVRALSHQLIDHIDALEKRLHAIKVDCHPVQRLILG